MGDEVRRRHFSYKHPTFGTKAEPKNDRAWKGSVYYWWWAYLKRSECYVRTCENPQTGELNGLYQHFGDVRGDDFKAWWNEGSRGAQLFGEPKTEGVRIVSGADELVPDSNELIVRLPLDLSKRYLQRRVRELLARHHKGRRGHTL